MQSGADPVANFRDAVLLNSDSQDSVTSYLKVLGLFCDRFKMSPTQLVAATSSGKFRPDLAVGEWIRSKHDLAPGTRRVYRCAMRKFFEVNLPDLDFRWDKVQVGRMRILETDRAPTKAELLKLMAVAGLKGKVVITFLTSSGVRRGTLARLKLKHIDLDRYPDVGLVKVPSELNKARIAYVTFITPQCKALLREYFRVRETGVRRPPEKLTPESPVIAIAGKPVRPAAISEIWGAMLERAGLGEKSRKFRTLRAHTARKFFATNLTMIGVHATIRERLMGHFSGFGNAALSMDANYFRPEEVQLLDAYRGAIPHLEIKETIEDTRSRQRALFDFMKITGFTDGEIAEVRDIYAKESDPERANEKAARLFRAARSFREIREQAEVMRAKAKH